MKSSASEPGLIRGVVMSLSFSLSVSLCLFMVSECFPLVFLSHGLNDRNDGIVAG